MKQCDFFSLLRKLDLSKEWRFHYNACYTDPMTSRYWVSHMNSYMFTLYCDGENHILESKKTSKTHFDLEELLIKKYTRWLNLYIKLNEK